MSFQHVLVTTDFSDAAARALGVAHDLATRFGAKLTLLHVAGHDPGVVDGVLAHETHARVDLRKRLQAKLEALASESALEATVAIETDESAVEGILRYVAANEVDLVVIASSGRTGLSRLLIGSVAERVVRHAPCAVLTVKNGD